MTRSPIVLALLLLAGLGAPSRASFDPVPRKVLALIDGAEGETMEENDVQEIMAFPLYHLGMPVRYHDLQAARLPAEEALEDARGVVLRLHQLDCRPRLREWVVEQHLAGRRVLVLTSLTPGEDPVEEPACEEEDGAVNEVLRTLGLTVSSVFTAEGVEELVRYREVAGEWFGFERSLRLGQPAPWYVFLRSLLPSNRSLLRAWIQGLEGSEADLVVLGDWGGFAVTEYLFAPSPETGHLEWIVDPLRFFEAVFGVEGMPRVDPNVLQGRRVFFTHVDGDGFNSFSLDRPAKICGQVILEDILLDERYGALPHTMSVISAEVDPTTTHVVPEVSIPTARTMFRLPQVEAASHAFSHPMDWRAGTLAFDDITQDGEPYRFDARKETVGSLERVAELSPEDRPPEVMLWSGSCNPDEETLRILSEAGYRNMNGGDPRLDEVQPSWTGVAPPVWQVGDQLRYSSGAANDYLMTNEWTPPFTGFKHIIETFKRTSVPRPLTPVNVYYHFYLAERESSLATLKTVFDWCLRQDYAHLFTSEYLEMLEDAQTATLARDGERWRIRTRGKLRTVRFDGPLRHVDLDASRGVLGYGHRFGSLYVYLDGTTEHEVVLGDEAARRTRLLEGSRPYHAVARREEELVAFRASGPGRSMFRFGGLEPETYVAVEWDRVRPASHRREIFRVDPDGVLEIRLALGPGARVAVLPAREADFRRHQWDEWFDAVGRYLLLVGLLMGAGWGLCRFHQPLLPEPLEVAAPEEATPEDAGGVVANLEIESGVPTGSPTDPGALPAGGTGTWSESFDMELFRDEDES